MIKLNVIHIRKLKEALNHRFSDLEQIKGS